MAKLADETEARIREVLEEISQLEQELGQIIESQQ